MMRLQLLITALPGALGAELGTADPPAAVVVAVPELRRSTTAMNVRSLPSTDAPILGTIAPDQALLVLARVEGVGCDVWGLVGGGYTCLTGTTPQAGLDPTATDLPSLVTFDPPRPEEYRAYLRDGTWPRDVATTEALLPFIYGRAARHWKGVPYASTAAWERGDPPVARTDDVGKYHFVGVVETQRGPVLVQEDEMVVPLDDVLLYAVSRFHGEELAGSHALAPGEVQAWVLPRSGANVRDAVHGAVLGVLPQRTAVRVFPTEDADWVRAPDAFGPGMGGFLATSVLRRVLPAPAPPELGPAARWIDVDVSEQVLMLLEGDTVLFATLVSTGLAEKDTPPGTYTVLDKTVYADMASKPNAEEPYLVEGVPWVVHFKPRYAMHGVFWHGGFGSRASHGCVNLAPLDARRVFETVTPYLPAGWSSAFSPPNQPGTTIRIRE